MLRRKRGVSDLSTAAGFFAIFGDFACQTVDTHSGKAVFAQLMDGIHPEQFNRCVRRYHGNYKVRHFSCWDQFLAMSFAQVTFRESLADCEICLRSRGDQLYHLGFRSSVAHSREPGHPAPAPPSGV